MKQIKLTRGKFALVDDSDFELLSKYRWCCSSDGYAMRKNGKYGKFIQMHRLINNTPEGFVTDHINGNKLDNRRSNLRTATYSQNNMNMRIGKRNKSGHKGISWVSTRNKWFVGIQMNYRTHFVGRFDKLEDAINAHKQASAKLFGNFSNV